MTSRSRDREPIAHVDQAWLRMDSPTNAMVITALLVFEDAPGFEGLLAFVRDRLLQEKRFRQRVVASKLLGGMHWEIDPDFELARHVHRVALPDPGGKLDLSAFVSDVVGTPLTEGRPLWQLHYVEGFRRGAAVVVRVHHAVGDGVALVRLLLGLSERASDAGRVEVGIDAPKPYGAVETAKLLGAQALALGRMLLLPADPKTPLKGELGPQKHAVFSRAHALARVKAASHRRGAKTNDLLLAAVTHALGRWLRNHDCETNDLELRALVPVYVKPAVESDGLGNHFGLVFVPLPIGMQDPEARVRELRQRMAAIKASPDAVVALEVLAALGIGGAEIEHVALEVFTKKASVMVTNIPGPREPVLIAGKPVSSLVVWAPVSGQIGLGLSLMSYAGQVRLGVSADAGLCRDPEAIVEAYEQEVDRLTAE